MATTTLTTTTTDPIRLEPSRGWTNTSFDQDSALSTTHTVRPEEFHHVDEDAPPPPDAIDALPNGGYGWTIVTTCAVFTFWTNGWLTTWGVLQAAIISSHTLPVSTSTITFVGSLALGLCVAFGLIATRLIRMFGARIICTTGILFMSLGTILASLTIKNIGGLFCTAGAMVGIGISLLYTASNVVPVHYFSTKLGMANGLVKMGGGIGTTVIAVASQELIAKVGVPWTFRTIGLLMLVTGIPCALLTKERTRGGSGPFVDWGMLRNVPFLCTCLAGMVCTFALFVPSFFLPLFAHSIGLSASTGAGLVAGFGLSTTIGRIAAGVACDKVGSMNTLLITMFFNTVSMLAIWPVSSTLAPLVIFAAINGIANGAFFVALPTAIVGTIYLHYNPYTFEPC